MTGATAFHRAATSGEFNQFQRQEFLSLYPNRIQGILRAPGSKTWTTVSKHFPISDEILLRAVAGEETNLWGLRWGDTTRFAVFDIDPGSKYQNEQELTRLNDLLAQVGLTTTVYQSSTRRGWHVYLFFDQYQNSTEVQQTLKSWLAANNYEIRNGVLEVFPSGMGLRLPLQLGFAWLDQSGNVLRTREELTTSQSLQHFLNDLTTRASDWEESKGLIESQLEQLHTGNSTDALAHLKATDTNGFDGLFNYRLIPEKYQDGRQFWKTGLSANGQRHDAILAVEHYLWHGDTEADIPAMPGQSNNRLRYELIRAWIEQKHNGCCNHINRGNWRKVEAQIKRAVSWRRSVGTNVREDYALTEKAIERLIGLYKSTGRVWSMDDFRKGNESRRETAREKIKAAFELLTSQGRKVTLRQLMRLTGCHHQTLNRHADIWRISQKPELTRVSGDLNPFLALDLIGAVSVRKEITCFERSSRLVDLCSNPVVSLFDRSERFLESSRVVTYTRNTPFFGFRVTDEVEKKTEAPQAPRSLEEIVRASQFTDPSKLETWTAATADYRVTQKDSATMEALSDEKIAEIKSNGGFQKFELFDSSISKSRETFIDPHPSFVEGLKAVGDDEEAQGRFSIEYMERKAQEALGVAQKPTEEQILLASNIVSSAPNVERMEQYQEIQSDSEKTKVAQYSDSFMSPPTLVPSPEQLGLQPIIDVMTDKIAVKAEQQWNPYRGEIDSEMRKIPEDRWHQAYEAFPQFKKAGLNEKQTVEIMQAIVRNELYNYDAADKEADEAVKAGKTPLLAVLKIKSEEALTLGISQLSTKAVHEREKEYPNQVDFKNNEEKALLSPDNVPILVAATLVHNIEMYQRHKIPITEKSLAYSYNPPAKHILPNEADLKSSFHVKNVMHQLDIIRHSVVPKADEI